MTESPLRRIRALIDRLVGRQVDVHDEAAFVAPPEPPSIPELIEELGLVAAPRPVREHPLWRRPECTLVTGASPALIDWLRPVAPGVDLVGIHGADDGLREVHRADAIIGWHTPEMIDRGTRLVWLQIHTAGVENALSSPAIAARGLLVTNLKRVAAPVIGEHVFAMLLALARRLADYRDFQRRGQWAQFDIPERALGTLRGKTLVVAGLGGIGTEVARLANAFGMRVLAVRFSDAPAPPFVEAVAGPSEVARFLASADVAVNALPLTALTRGLFDERLFRAMKPGATFVNVARGGSVVTEDLTRALRDGMLGAAALDVVEPEPLPRHHPLWRMPNVLITPHVAGLSLAGSDARWLVIRENLRRYTAGEPLLSVVDASRGY